MFTRLTFTGTAPSGFEFELNRMKAYHQEWLTQGKKTDTGLRGAKKNKSEKRVEDIMADILVRIDDDTDITAEKLLSVPSWDFKYMLFVARYFSCDMHFTDRMDEWNKHLIRLELWKVRKQIVSSDLHEESALEEMRKTVRKLMKLDDGQDVDLTSIVENEELWGEDEPEYESTLPDHLFKFKYEWKKQGEILQHEYEVPLHLHDFAVFKPWRSFTWKELQDRSGKDGITLKDIKLMLPIAKQEIVWHILDLDIEEKNRGGFQPDEVHINTGLKWRNPRVMSEKQSQAGSFMPISSNSSKFEYLDIEAYRLDVWQKEGRMDSILSLELPATGEIVKVDVLNTATFFIPSGVL